MSMQWTYKVIVMKTKGLRYMLTEQEIQEALNQHGSLGWELVDVAQVALNRVTLYLKKPK